VGEGLRIPELPSSYREWRVDRDIHLQRDLFFSEGTAALYDQYRRQLGPWRYYLLLRVQSVLTPAHVRGLLGLKRAHWLRPLLALYPLLVRVGLRSMIQRLLMPAQYLATVRAMDHVAASSVRGVRTG
jgi:hypothetical protein